MKQEDSILKGFNAGYLLQKHEPELAKSLRKVLEGNDKPYVQGFLAGSKEYLTEIEPKQKMKFPGGQESFLEDLSEKYKGKSPNQPDKGQDMDI